MTCSLYAGYLSLSVAKSCADWASRGLRDSGVKVEISPLGMDKFWATCNLLDMEGVAITEIGQSVIVKDNLILMGRKMLIDYLSNDHDYLAFASL